jgi:membrane-associated phospholipid phosphatase
MRCKGVGVGRRSAGESARLDGSGEGANLATDVLHSAPVARAAEAAGTARAAAHRVTLPERAVVARGRGAVAIAALALGAFAVLFAVVRTGRSTRLDHDVTVRFQRQRAPGLRRLMALVSWPGFPPQSRLLPPSIAGALWALGFRLEAIFQFLAWGTSGVSFTFKRIMRRERPNHPEIAVAVARIGGTSFPSGHVINYMGVYGFLAYLVHTWVRPAGLRRVVVGFLLGLLALVGPSRVYLGHHWATDVSASYLLGTTYLLGITAVYRRVKTWALNR